MIHTLIKGRYRYNTFRIKTLVYGWEGQYHSYQDIIVLNFKYIFLIKRLLKATNTINN